MTKQELINSVNKDMYSINVDNLLNNCADGVKWLQDKLDESEFIILCELIGFTGGIFETMITEEYKEINENLDKKVIEITRRC